MPIMTQKDLSLHNIFLRKVPDRSEIIAVRQFILQRILVFCLLPGIFAVIPGAYQTWSQGRWGYSLFYILSYLLFLISFVSVRRKNYRIGGVMLVTGLFCLSIAVLSRLGLSGVGLEIMVVACFASSVLFSIKRSLVLIGLGVVIMALISYGMIHNWLVIYESHMLTSKSWLAWLTAVVVFFLGTLLMVISPQMFLIRLEESLESARQKAEHLKQSNELLFREMSKRIQVEEEKRQLRQYLRNIIDFMPSVLIGIDQDSRVTHWNKEAENATGHLSKAALGAELTGLFPQLTGQMEKIRLAITENQIQKESKLVMELKSGTRLVDLLTYPIRTGDTLGAVIRLDDISSRVELEERIIQTDKLASIGCLTAGIAHEINNPLGVILQGVQMINNRFSTALRKNLEVAARFGIDLEKVAAYMEDRNISKYLEGIKYAGHRSAEIIGNMLQFSRKSESKKKIVEIRRLIEKVLIFAGNDFDLKKRYDFKKIEILKEYDQTLDSIICNETEIEQVLLNMVKNATQAFGAMQSDADPRIIFRTRNEGSKVLIEIEDNGPGMDPKVVKRIFEPFFTTKEVGQGTGLGLSVAYMIITNNHGGTMEVKSEPGVGSTFAIRLPK
jgi:PAS domain S-box-containing protein